MATVLKRFPYAKNGFTVKNFNVGDEGEFGDATEGLITAGYISVESNEPKKKK